MAVFNLVAISCGQISWPYSILWPYLVAKSLSYTIFHLTKLFMAVKAIFNLLCRDPRVIRSFFAAKQRYFSELYGGSGVFGMTVLTW